jgi:hypothetical protein
MLEPKRLIRKSLSGTDYQFEYIPTPVHLERDTNGKHNTVTEYRVRRGAALGTWTRWFKTNDLGNTLINLGFRKKLPATLMHDFAFESLLGRGEITLNKKMVRAIANEAGFNHLGTHLYSRLKQVADDRWIMPSSAIMDQQVYAHLKKIISKNL